MWENVIGCFFDLASCTGWTSPLQKDFYQGKLKPIFKSVKAAKKKKDIVEMEPEM